MNEIHVIVAGSLLEFSLSQTSFPIGRIQLSGMSDYLELTKSDLSTIYRGALSERFVGQELICSNDGDLCYWARDKKGSSAEVDYLVVINGKPYPIEVKSGKAGSLKSMHMFLENCSDCPSGLVFSTRSFARLAAQKMVFLPLYYSGGMISENHF